MSGPGGPDGGEPARPPAKRRHTGRVSRYTPALGEAICGRLAAGESLEAICRDPALPCRHTIVNWTRRLPAFREQYARARERQRGLFRSRGLPENGGGGRTRYTDALAEAICDRLAAGESLVKLCADPGMPGISTVMRWAERNPEFRAMYTRARALQAHALADEVLHTIRRDDLAPADKQARLKGLTWMAGKLAPVKYGEVPEEGEGPALLTIVVKNGGYEGTE
jgi:hypothetical protein